MTKMPDKEQPVGTRRILIITYHYPPSEEGNPYLTNSWVRYLPEMGWEPIVLTSLKATHETQDDSTEIIAKELRSTLY